MRFIRFIHGGIARWGTEHGDSIHVLSASPTSPDWTRTGEVVPADGITLMPPIEAAAKIVGVAMNYPPAPDGPSWPTPQTPTIFLKATSSAVGPGDAIELPAAVGEIVHEGELAVVIGRRAARVPASSALDHVLGCTIANDVTAREQMLVDRQWARAKSYDTFCPLGPAIETDVDPDAADIVTRVGDEVRRAGNSADMTFSVAELIAFVSDAMTLNPGDVILTGSPAGRGAFTAGDVVSITVGGIGTLTNPSRTRA